MKKQYAINYFGGVGKLATAIGIAHSAVSQWGENIPELRAYQIEDLIKTAKQRNVDLSQLRISKTGCVINKTPKGETPHSICRELERLSINTPTVGA